MTPTPGLARLAMRAATVDHFVSKTEDRRGAYDWHDSRLAALVNSFKGEHDVVDLCAADPKGEVWFVLDLLTFKVRQGAATPTPARRRRRPRRTPRARRRRSAA